MSVHTDHPGDFFAEQRDVGPPEVYGSLHLTENCFKLFQGFCHGRFSLAAETVHSL